MHRLVALMTCAMLIATPLAALPMVEAQQDFGPTNASRNLLVRSTTDLAAFAPVLEEFTALHPDIHISYEQWGSNDLYQMAVAACDGTVEAADLVISSAVDQQVKLVNDGCAQSHVSPETAALSAELRWRDQIFGITREPAVMVYNRRLVPPSEAPRSRFDLLDLLRPEGSRYAYRVATYDIEASGLGYLFAFADAAEATTFGQLIEAFGRAHAVATCCSSEIIDGVASGRYLIAYNVLGSYALARAKTDPDLSVVAPEDYTLILSRAALIPSHAANPVAAGDLLDFLLSPAGLTVLTRVHLIVDPGEISAGQSADAPATLRAIPLSPVLLLGLDRQRRAQFIALWRKTFPGIHSNGSNP